MKRTTLFIIFAVSLLVIDLQGQQVSRTGSAADGPHPIAVCPQQQYNWGLTFIGEDVTHTFTILNKGDAVLKILNVQETCKCTTVDFSKTIPPGGKGFVTVKIKTKGMKRAATKKTYVITNDPRHKKITLYVGGNLQELFKLKPLFPTMKGIIGEGILTADVSLVNDSKELIQSLKLMSEPKRFTIKMETVKPGRIFKFYFKTIPGLRLPGNATSTSEEVKLEAKTKDKTIHVSFNANITLQPRIELSPKWLYFRRKETELLNKKPLKIPGQKVQIIAADGIDFKIKKIITHGDIFSAHLLPGNTPNKQTLLVQVNKFPEGSKPFARGEVEIQTTDPINKTVKIKVMAFFNYLKKQVH